VAIEFRKGRIFGQFPKQVRSQDLMLLPLENVGDEIAKMPTKRCF